MLARASLGSLICLLASSVARPQAPPAEEPAVAEAAVIAAQPAALQIPPQTPVRIRVDEEISSEKNHAGDRFRISVVSDVIVDGGVVIPAGTVGEGEVIHAVPVTTGGQPGELSLVARFLRMGEREVRLHAMNASGSGKDRVGGAHAVGLLLGLAPVIAIPIGASIKGGAMVVPAGTEADVKTIADQPVAENPLPGEEAAESAGGSAPIAFGTVIFFRKEVLGGGAIRVIEEGRGIGLLKNKTWFAVKAPVGRHNYITKLLDMVTVEVEEGGTYYVAGEISTRWSPGGGKRLNLRPATATEFAAVKAKLDDASR